MFMDFRMIWLMDREQSMYQKIQAGMKLMESVRAFSPKYGKTIDVSILGIT
jgi:hypothetical protein